MRPAQASTQGIRSLSSACRGGLKAGVILGQPTCLSEGSGPVASGALLPKYLLFLGRGFALLPLLPHFVRVPLLSSLLAQCTTLEHAELQMSGASLATATLGQRW